jgi:hypothetical protein
MLAKLMTDIKDPYRNDIFEDESGHRVAVKRLYTPNAMGVSYVEYKSFFDSSLRFMPKEQFMEVFHWVDNFGSTDTFVRVDEVVEAPKKADKEAPKEEVPAKPADEANANGDDDHQQGQTPPKRMS